MPSGVPGSITHGNSGYASGCRCGVCRSDMKARVLKTKTRKRAELAALKAAPCSDCGALYPSYVMQFDHRPGEEKLAEVGRLVTHRAETLLAEVAKCDLVCANCHAERTWQRNQFGKSPATSRGEEA